MPYERTIAGSSGGTSAEICSPMKMFDYMAAGRCIVASDLPVMHEVLNPCNAVFCPPEDLSAWQSALGKLINDPALCKALSEQAALDARQYSWQTREDHALEGFL
jgi:glycosyltransferase involved in cell wall biosynthesis